MFSVIQGTVTLLLCINCLSAEKAFGCFALRCLKLCNNVNWFYDDLTTTIPIQCQDGVIRLDWITFSVPDKAFCVNSIDGKDTKICEDSNDGCKTQFLDHLEASRKKCDHKQYCTLKIKARDVGPICQPRLKYPCYYWDEKMSQYACYSKKVQINFGCVKSKY